MSEPTFAVRASHEELLARLSLEEKITLLTGADFDGTLLLNPGPRAHPARSPGRHLLEADFPSRMTVL